MGRLLSDVHLVQKIRGVRRDIELHMRIASVDVSKLCVASVYPSGGIISWLMATLIGQPR